MVIAKKERFGWQKSVVPWVMVVFGVAQLIGGFGTTIQCWAK
jgi:hypothetical protein